MKILLVNWMDMANPMAGGAEVHLQEIFKRFVRRGDEITMVTSGFKCSSRYDEQDGIQIIHTGSRETFNITAPRVLKALEQRTRFDLVVEDINKVPLFTPLYLKKPLFVIIPHLFGTTVFRETNPLLASYVCMMERFIPLFYRHTLFEVVSESTARNLENRGIPRKRIRVVLCGMDHETYNSDVSTAKFDQPTILYVGRIKRYKSIDVAVKAMPSVLKHVPSARLVIVGSGDNLNELKHLAGRLGVSDHVLFTGFVPPEVKVDWMRRSHVIVNPSPKEGWGLTNIEANACGTIAVASDADGLRDSVKDGETGLLFPYGDHVKLAEKLVTVLADEALRKRLEERALEWARTFTWDECAIKTMRVADEVIRTTPRFL